MLKKLKISANFAHSEKSAHPAHSGNSENFEKFKKSSEKANFKGGSLNSIRREIQKIHLFLIIAVTLLFCFGGAYLQVLANDKAFNQNLQDTAELIKRIYSFAGNMERDELRSYMDGLVEKLPDIDVLSIIDEKGIRLYHSNHELIGTVYDGKIPDFGFVPHNFYTEDDTGPSGAQRRTYAAVTDAAGNYCGFVMTIMLKKSIRMITLRTLTLFFIIACFAILIEIAISEKISQTIRQKLMGFEPDTFSSMYKIRENILESIYDGIVAVDREMNIQFVNMAAKKILGSDGPDCKINEIKEKVFADKYLLGILHDGSKHLGRQEYSESGAKVILDCFPVMEDKVVTGAVAILHDRTEYIKLIDELSGTKYLVDSMRANNHDFTNKLHVILGLIQIGQYEKAVSYIENISLIQRQTLSKVMNAIDCPAFAALLVGKIARASECNVQFVLKEDIHFKSSDVDVPSQALVTICGNLIDNALDAMNMQSNIGSELRELTFGVFTKPHALLITVDDTGCGISEENKSKVFLQGFSTKGRGRGVGLYHTRQLVESLGGCISFESQQGVGSSFMVIFRQDSGEKLDN